jgi:hypothetical protein
MGFTNANCDIKYSIGKSDLEYNLTDDNSLLYITAKEEGKFIIEVNAMTDCDTNLFATGYINVCVSKNANNWGNIQLDSMFEQFFMLSKDKLFEYKINATSLKEECGIKYSVSPKPDFADDMFFRYAEGATIDSKTGVLTWTPTEAGSYFLILRRNGIGYLL